MDGYEPDDFEDISFDEGESRTFGGVEEEGNGWGDGGSSKRDGGSSKTDGSRRPERAEGDTSGASRMSEHASSRTHSGSTHGKNGGDQASLDALLSRRDAELEALSVGARRLKVKRKEKKAARRRLKVGVRE